MNRLALPLILLAALAVHLAMAEPTEPFFNGDETRHVMTGIFVADALTEGGWKHPKSYAERYYAQYPALGLIVWPPGFYAVEGVAMLIFGRAFETGRWLTVAYSLLATAFLFRMAKRTHGLRIAIIASLVFAFTREVFFFSRNVMLELPMTAFLILAMDSLDRFLESRRRRELWLCALACVLAGLHRYDAVLIVLAFAARLAITRQWRVLLHREVILAALAVIVLLAPVYGLAVWQIGGMQARIAESGSDPLSVHDSRWSQYALFFTTLWAQLGHVAFALGVLGLLLSFGKAERRKNAGYWSLALATYLFYAPMADQESRHAIPWVGPWSVWAATVVFWLTDRRELRILLAFLLVAGTAFWTLHQPVPWVRHYAIAAQAALAETDGTSVVLFDGHFSGTMAYELRTRDSDRRLWLARADKLFAASLSDPHHGYVEWAKDDDAIRERLQAISPDLVMLEVPRARTETPMAMKLRAVLANHPDYVLVGAIPIETNGLRWAVGVRVLVYKPKNPRKPGERSLAIPMLWQGGQIEAVIPK